MTVEEVEDLLADYNLERCPGCEWWMEAGLLIDEHLDVVGCDQCREQKED
jgi:hypothetical protein